VLPAVVAAAGPQAAEEAVLFHLPVAAVIPTRQVLAGRQQAAVHQVLADRRQAAVRHQVLAVHRRAV